MLLWHDKPFLFHQKNVKFRSEVRFNECLTHPVHAHINCQRRKLCHFIGSFISRPTDSIKQWGYLEKHIIKLKWPLFLAYYTCTCSNSEMYLVIFLGTTEVDEFNHTPAGDHDIGSFDVTVDDGIRVEVIEGSGDLPGIVSYCATIKRTKPTHTCIYKKKTLRFCSMKRYIQF